MIWRAQSAVKFEETRPCFVCHKYVLVLMQFFMIVEGESEKQFKLRKLPRFLKLQVKGGRRNILKPNFCVWSSFTISMIICLHFSIQCFNSLFMVCPEGTWKFIESLLIYNYVWGLTSHFKADQRSIKKCFIWRESFHEQTTLSNRCHIWVVICCDLRAYSASVLSNVRNKYFKS